MINILADVGGFLLLCVGAKMATPALLRLLCRIAVAYVTVFSVCYYLWLLPKYHFFKHNPELLHTGISAAFRFEGFWKLFANMVLLQAVIPVATIMLLYFAVKWLSASTGPGSSYY
jgi:hypothetical protein